MKEIKAYFRPGFADRVVTALEKAGAKDLTVIRVEAFGPLADASTDEHHLFRKYVEKYSSILKLELVCTDDEAARFAEIIRGEAHTGDHGDGRVFIAPVEQVVNIRTGDTGAKAL